MIVRVGRDPHGLSPRVRGNPAQGFRGAASTRSIPACTGEPHIRYRWRRRAGVYPRVYGGTTSTSVGVPSSPGLSPRVRGNHRAASGGRAGGRSIPACTGEPPYKDERFDCDEVYPRVYGGTVCILSQVAVSGGLSPRVRGNRQDRVGGGRRRGSIPACTGEPTLPGPSPCGPGVYPRVYGGTPIPSCVGWVVGGLSPRVRGNHGPNRRYAKMARSIPACTGEPCRKSPTRRRRRVYPRVYGGTLSISLAGSLHPGLSPRVRGNPVTTASPLILQRSIPACTGEPWWDTCDQCRRWVYPRVYGGTWTTATHSSIC